MAKRTPAPKSPSTPRPRVDAVTPPPVAAPMVSALVPPSPSLATPRPVAPRSLADWVMLPTYLGLAILFVPVSWLTGTKKAK